MGLSRIQCLIELCNLFSIHHKCTQPTAEVGTIVFHVHLIGCGGIYTTPCASGWSERRLGIGVLFSRD